MNLILLSVSPSVEVQKKLFRVRYEEWLSNDVFHFRWFTLLALFMVCIYFWWKLVDKSRLKEILLYISIITIVILLLDELGEELTLWDYKTDLFPLFPPITAIDLACMPSVYSLIYQLFSKWRSFIIATLIMSGVFCFVFEPIFIWLDVYQLLIWKFYYGFPIYTGMALAAKAIVSKIYIISQNAKSNY